MPAWEVLSDFSGCNFDWAHSSLWAVRIFVLRRAGTNRKSIHETVVDSIESRMAVCGDVVAESVSVCLMVCADLLPTV